MMSVNTISADSLIDELHGKINFVAYDANGVCIAGGNCGVYLYSHANKRWVRIKTPYGEFRLQYLPASEAVAAIEVIKETRQFLMEALKKEGVKKVNVQWVGYTMQEFCQYYHDYFVKNN